MKCPYCGSNHIENIPVTYTTTQQKTNGYNGCLACLGVLLFNWWGLLCGLCGMGKGSSKTIHRTTIEHECRQCGRRF